MSLDLALKAPLELLEQQHELIQATILQIEKDFLQNGLELSWSKSDITSVAQLATQLTEVFEWLLERDEQRLLQILYRIDLGEEKLQSAMRNNVDQSLAALLSKMVLLREAQKVIIRHHYKRVNHD